MYIKIISLLHNSITFYLFACVFFSGFMSAESVAFLMYIIIIKVYVHHVSNVMFSNKITFYRGVKKNTKWFVLFGIYGIYFLGKSLPRAKD